MIQSDIFTIAVYAIYLIVVYLIGSIPTGYWLAKYLKGIDIRTVGSGSTGATNVYRSIGKTAGVFVFIIDFLKGYLPVIIAEGLLTKRIQPLQGCCFDAWMDSYYILPVLTSAVALIGHSRSIFLGFKGGKSAATGLGTLFALDFRVGLFTFIVWMVVICFGKIVSVASILATASCILFMIFFRPIPSYVVYCILGFIYVSIRHKANIGRILAGTEPKIGEKSK